MGNILKKPKPKPKPNRSQKDEQIDQNQPFMCEICVELMLLPDKKFKNNNNCTHSFCVDCITKYIKTKLDDKVGEIPCPALNCKQSLDPVTCRFLIGTQPFAQWCDLLYEKALLNMDRWYCPDEACSVLIVNECSKKVWWWRRSGCNKCPICRKKFCFKCKLPYHKGYSCNVNMDKSFVRVAGHNRWQRCPRCRYFVERIEGCRTIYCRCGCFFCYKCGRKFSDCCC